MPACPTSLSRPALVRIQHSNTTAERRLCLQTSVQDVQRCLGLRQPAAGCLHSCCIMRHAYRQPVHMPQGDITCINKKLQPASRTSGKGDEAGFVACAEVASLPRHRCTDAGADALPGRQCIRRRPPLAAHARGRCERQRIQDRQHLHLIHTTLVGQHIAFWLPLERGVRGASEVDCNVLSPDRGGLLAETAQRPLRCRLQSLHVSTLPSGTVQLTAAGWRHVSDSLCMHWLLSSEILNYLSLACCATSLTRSQVESL